MSTKQVEKLRVEICNLIKDAAQRSKIKGDEPLVVLTTLAAKMVSEIDNDVERIAMAKAVAETFEDLVNSYRTKIIIEEKSLIH